MRRLIHILLRAYELSIYYILGGVVYAKKVGVKVGKDCRIYTNLFGTEPELIQIGNRVTITSGVKFLTHDGSTWLFRDQKGRRYFYNKIIIGNDVFVGVNTILLPGVVIEDQVIVAAGSVVTKSVKRGNIIGGNPAKIIGSYSDYEQRCLKNYLSDFSFKKMNSPIELKSLVVTPPKNFIGE